MAESEEIIELYLNWYYRLDECKQFELLIKYPSSLSDLFCEQHYIFQDKDAKDGYTKKVLDILIKSPQSVQIFLPLIRFWADDELWISLANIEEIKTELIKVSKNALEHISIDMECPDYLPEYDYEFKLFQQYNSFKDSHKFTELYDIAAIWNRSYEDLLISMKSVFVLYIKVLCENSWSDFINILNGEQNFLNVCLISACIDDKMHLRAALDTNNPMFVFDTLRHFLYNKTFADMKQEDLISCMGSYKAVIKKMTLNLNIWHEILRYFLRNTGQSPVFLYIVFSIIEELNEIQIEEIIKNLKIEVITDKEDDIFESCIKPEISDSESTKWRFFYSSLFNKWEQFIQKEVKAPSNKIYTNVDIGIKFYVENIMEEKEKEKLVSQYKNDFIEFPNIWYGSELDMKYSFYRMLSEYDILI